MRPASQITNADTERELRRAVLALNDDPQDADANGVLLDFVKTVLRIGRPKTGTARRIAS